jgi:TolB protein
MSNTVSLAHLLSLGLRLQRYEALAIAQQLIAHREGIPTAQNVELSSDGCARCISRTGTPEVAHIAALLHELLPTTEVPAPLRSTLARGLRTVESPPFASLEAFSEALSLFEAGDRQGIVRALMQRIPGSRPPRPPVAIAALPPARQARVTRPSSEERPARAAAVPPAPPAALLLPNAAPAVTAEHRRGEILPRRTAIAVVAALLVIGALISGAGLWSPASHESPPAVQESQSLQPSVPVQESTGAQPKVQPAPTNALSSRAPELPASPSSDGSEAPPAAAPPAAAPVREIGRVVGGRSQRAFSPAFAPDGRALFFHTGGARDATSAIARATSADAAGEPDVVTVLNDGSRNYHPQPSPDGRLIAFDSDRDGDRGVFIANADGTDIRRISASGYAAVPTWSPDGKRLAYIRAEPGRPQVWNLWVQAIDEPRATRVTSHRYGQTWAASWFPDNQRISYTHEATLVVKDLNTGRTRKFASPVAGRLLRTPAVSPDGSKVVFQVFRRGAWLLDVESGSMRRILEDPVAEEFAWAPDGERIAFHSRRGGDWGIYVMAI